MNCTKGDTAADTSTEINTNRPKRICSRGQPMLRVDVNIAKNEGDGGGGGVGGGGGAGSGGGMQELMSPPTAGVHQGHYRRESFLYRPEVLDGELSPTRSRQSSRCDSSPLEDMIVTPLAQLIDSLRKVKSNYLMLLKIPQIRQTSSKDFEAVHFPVSSDTSSPDESRQRIAMETLEELEWCLDQLENIQTDRSAAQITTNKFKRMLNRELFQYVDADKGRSQVSRYISRTFIDDIEADHEEMLVAHEPGAREDQRRVVKGLSKDSPGQPETSGLLTLKDNAKALIRKKCLTYYPTNCPAQTIPKYGVKTKDEDQLSQQLQNLNIWGMDMFKLAKAAANKPLTAVTYTILKERGLLETFRISPGVLLNFLSNLENHYRTDNPYHNSLHAADVTQSSHVLLLLPAFRNIFTDLEILATIFASAAHDVDHPGLNSQFLINSNSELALLYNDESVLENHHLAVAFQLLQQEKCDVFSNLSKKQRQQLRHLVIGMILATDMSKHVEHLANLKTMVELRRLSGNSRIEVDNPSHRQQILKSLVHCADLSNPTKSLEVYSRWTDKVMEEFFRQGDKEKQLGLDVSPMCDRDTAKIASAQVGFIDFIVQPLWETWADLVFPDCQKILDAIESNRQHHQQHLDRDQHLQDNHHPEVA